MGRVGVSWGGSQDMPQGAVQPSMSPLVNSDHGKEPASSARQGLQVQQRAPALLALKAQPGVAHDGLAALL